MNMDEKEIKKDLTTLSKGIIQNNDSEYVRLVSQISGLWEKAKEKAAFAVNTELLKASWQTGRYIVEFEQGGNTKARYGEQLITNLAKDLTRMRGRGFSRSNLIYMRKFYLTFPKSETLSHQLTWSIDNQLFAARYQLYLPNREELQSQLDNLLNNSY